MRSEKPASGAVITSAANPQIKLMRSLGRRKARQAERAFLVEGQRLVAEAARAGVIRTVLAREDVPDDWVDRAAIDPAIVRRVRGEIFDAASDVEHTQGVAAICEMPVRAVRIEDVVAERAFVLILDRLRDPGNVGTTLRSAAAAGVRIVLVTRSTADPFAPKVVRAGMGAHFRLTVGDANPELVAALHGTGRAIVHADADAEMRYSDFPWEGAGALVIGGETEALSDEMTRVATHDVAIPMRGAMESLNAGVAASVLLFEAQRQGRI